VKHKFKNTGLTLIEQTVVLGVVALLVTISMPTVSSLFNSFQAGGSAKIIINGAIATARAIAAKEQRYAGVRFQCRYDKTKSNKMGTGYMILIIHDTEIKPGEQGNLSFRAVEGVEPIKLPDSVGLMDLKKNGTVPLVDVILEADLIDTTTFTIIFSPAGKLVIHKHWVRNRDGETDSSSKDDIFNILANVETGLGLFEQDETSGNRQIEPSRRKFIIYDKDELEKTNTSSRYTDYLKDLDVIHISPYTGRMIE
jgi:hypothetical protein